MLFCGPCSSFLFFSDTGLPNKNFPAGIGTIVNESELPGIDCRKTGKLSTRFFALAACEKESNPIRNKIFFKRNSLEGIKLRK
jgi:hypothetical protein